MNKILKKRKFSSSHFTAQKPLRAPSPRSPLLPLSLPPTCSLPFSKRQAFHTCPPASAGPPPCFPPADIQLLSQMLPPPWRLAGLSRAHRQMPPSSHNPKPHSRRPGPPCILPGRRGALEASWHLWQKMCSQHCPAHQETRNIPHLSWPGFSLCTVTEKDKYVCACCPM